MKKLIAFTAAVVMILSCSAGQCFAENRSVPVYLQAAATSVNFSITEKLTMTAAAGTPELTVDQLVITNTGTMGQICLDKLEASAANGWKLVSESSDFINMAADAKNISLKTGSHDFAESGSWQPDTTAKVGESMTMEFSARTGPSSEAVADLQVVTLVATISLY